MENSIIYYLNIQYFTHSYLCSEIKNYSFKYRLNKSLDDNLVYLPLSNLTEIIFSIIIPFIGTIIGAQPNTTYTENLSTILIIIYVKNTFYRL